MTEEREALQELIIQAHQAIKDLRGVIGQAKKIRDDIEKVVEVHTDMMISTVVARTTDRVLAEYMEAVDKSIGDAERSVIARFDRLSNILLNGTPRGPRGGRDSELEEAIKQIVQERGF